MSEDFSARLAAGRSGDADAFSQTYAAAYDELRAIAHRQLRIAGGGALTSLAPQRDRWIEARRAPTHLPPQRLTKSPTLQLTN